MGVDAVLGFLAGVLSTLSPCVLPMLPILLAAATSAHRLGPVAVAGGVAVSFTAVGTFVAVVGFSIGLDGDVFRAIAGTLMILVGIVLLAPAVQTRLAVAAGPVSDWASSRFGGFRTDGMAGQFALGLLLGAVWREPSQCRAGHGERRARCRDATAPARVCDARCDDPLAQPTALDEQGHEAVPRTAADGDRTPRRRHRRTG